MRVGIDARFITRPPRRGIGNYSLHLVTTLVELYPDVKFFLYISIPDTENLLPQGENVTVRRLEMPAYPFWEQIALPTAAKNDRLDVLHCLGNTAPIIMPKSIRLVLSLHDVMFLQNGKFVPKPTNRYQALGRHYRRIVSPRCARRADHLITVSDFSRQDILNLIPGLDGARVHVTYQSCDPAFSYVRPVELGASLSEENFKRPYIFTLGADDPRKNTLRLVQAYLSLLKQNAIEHDLIIGGYANWENSESCQLVKSAGITEKVKFSGFTTLDELVRFYRDADLFVYPSLYEGFGIPVLEAFSSGCPVIASNATSIPEVGGNAALYIDPMSMEDMRSAILRVIHEPDLRISLSHRGYSRAHQFSWKEVARKTFAIYEACLDDPIAT